MGFVELLKSLVGKKGWDYEERRGKLRVSCRIQASLLHKQGMMGCDIQNISVKGMKLMCYSKVKKGSQIQLKGVKQYNQAEIHEVNCRVEWVEKGQGGWLAGVQFTDSLQEMSRSWLYWELKTQNVRMIGADQRRETYRVRTNVPATIRTDSESLKAKVVNLSPGGAMVQALGSGLLKGQVVTLNFGPVEKLPRISAKTIVASAHVEGATVYGLRILDYSHGGPEDLKQYLDFFFTPP
ncbi:MAG: PilZ domain-containing protein [Candidatus Eremiobacteraeota bacterium]|nr:PilZ domain-containing protein [Candidatus Eremiobacteraeota bacterium]